MNSDPQSKRSGPPSLNQGAGRGKPKKLFGVFSGERISLKQSAGVLLAGLILLAIFKHFRTGENGGPPSEGSPSPALAVGQWTTRDIPSADPESLTLHKCVYGTAQNVSDKALPVASVEFAFHDLLQDEEGNYTVKESRLETGEATTYDLGAGQVWEFKVCSEGEAPGPVTLVGRFPN